MTGLAYALGLLAAAIVLGGTPALSGLRISETGTLISTKTPRDGPGKAERGNDNNTVNTMSASPGRGLIRGLAGVFGNYLQTGDRRHRALNLPVAADIELFVACIRAGLSVQQATSALALAANDRTVEYWQRVSALLSIGAEPQRAWQPVASIPGLCELGRVIISAQESGAAISQACQRLIVRLRADAADHAVAQAERAGVFISLPLAVCFLPAFILLGLVPVVVSLGTQLL
ncbi:MAG: type II secretion system F family protein [Corynebacterium sp.]|nr:type II secretion system F family protein [Corynebacterium sp.]